MRRREPDRLDDEKRDRPGGMQHDPASSGDKPGLGRSMERERGAIRPHEPERKRGDTEIIR
jgi:hypothetical protein